MAFLGRARKADLIVMAEELGEAVTPEILTINIWKLITSSKNYVEEVAKVRIIEIVQDRKAKDEKEYQERKEKEYQERKEKEYQERKEKMEREFQERMQEQRLLLVLKELNLQYPRQLSEYRMSASKTETQDFSDEKAKEIYRKDDIKRQCSDEKAKEHHHGESYDNKHTEKDPELICSSVQVSPHHREFKLESLPNICRKRKCDDDSTLPPPPTAKEETKVSISQEICIDRSASTYETEEKPKVLIRSDATPRRFCFSSEETITDIETASEFFFLEPLLFYSGVNERSQEKSELRKEKKKINFLREVINQQVSENLNSVDVNIQVHKGDVNFKINNLNYKENGQTITSFQMENIKCFDTDKSKNILVHQNAMETNVLTLTGFTENREILIELKFQDAKGMVDSDKKDGSSRRCIDNKALNALAKTDSPMEDATELLFAERNSEIINILNLLNEFVAVTVHEDSRDFTPFKAHRSHHRFKIVFGELKSVSTTKEQNDISLSIFCDDMIAVFSRKRNALRMCIKENEYSGLEVPIFTHDKPFPSSRKCVYVCQSLRLRQMFTFPIFNVIGPCSKMHNVYTISRLITDKWKLFLYKFKKKNHNNSGVDFEHLKTKCL